MILKKVALVLTLGTGRTSAVTGTQVPDAGSQLQVAPEMAWWRQSMETRAARLG